MVLVSEEKWVVGDIDYGITGRKMSTGTFSTDVNDRDEGVKKV